MPKIFSFDVFDTCVTRPYLEPRDLLLAVCQEYLETTGQDASRKSTFALWRMRLWAEVESRKASEQEDTTLDEIYSFWQDRYPGNLDFSRLKAIELRTEIQACIAVPSVLARVKALSDSGTVVFTSDMYLPQSAVVAILKNCGFPATQENTYVSSEIGVTKASGNLYSHLCQQHGCEPQDIHHIGDNWKIDVVKARAAGARAEHLQPICGNRRYLASLTGRGGLVNGVRQFLWRNSRHARRYINPYRAGESIQSILAASQAAGIARLAASNENSSATNIAREIGAYIAGPPLFAYCEWVIDEAQQMGIKNLYFAARNGQILWEISKRIISQRSLDLRAHYFYGSRSAWYPLKFSKLDDAEAAFVSRKYSHLSAQRILEQIGLSSGEATRVLSALGSSTFSSSEPLGLGDITNLFALIREANLSDEVLSAIHKRKKAFSSYIEQEGIRHGEPFAIVDVGWRLTTHNAFFDYVAESPGHRGLGFYFGVSSKHDPTAHPFRAFFCDQSNAVYRWLFKLGAVAIIEEIFTAADHGTTKSYFFEDGSWKPLLEEARDLRSPTTKDVQDAILEYAHRAAQLTRNQTPIKDRSFLIRPYERLYKFPSRAEAQCLADTQVDYAAGHGEELRRKLCAPIANSELPALVWHALFARNEYKPKWTWAQGSLACSNFCIAIVGRILAFAESLAARFFRGY